MTAQPVVTLTTQPATSHAPPTDLCVAIARTAPSVERGHPVQWTVSAWTAGGNAADATLELRAAPASGGAPGFSFGCGTDNGTSTCDLGAVDAHSAQRQLQAQLTVPVTASSVRSVTLAVIGSTTGLARDPEATATVAITAPPVAPKPPATSQVPATTGQAPATAGQAPAPTGQPPTASGQGQAPPIPTVVASPLPVASLPSIPAASAALSPGGNAASLFPTIAPKPAVRPTGTARTRAVANTAALPQGASVVGAQLAGLAALAVAFVLAVARLSLRRRPPTQPAQGAATPAAEGGGSTSKANASHAEESQAPASHPEANETDATTQLPAQDA